MSEQTTGKGNRTTLNLGDRVRHFQTGWGGTVSAIVEQPDDFPDFVTVQPNDNGQPLTLPHNQFVREGATSSPKGEGKGEAKAKP